ncbi:phosphoesterase family-domain-containing protein [Chytriomyces sp. MP71]|nr:phosphoesterase family-domain-containing protein [Chytriomyces sp. MP71]
MFQAAVLWLAASALAVPAAVPSCADKPAPIVSIVTSFASSAGFNPSTGTSSVLPTTTLQPPSTTAAFSTTPTTSTAPSTTPLKLSAPATAVAGGFIQIAWMGASAASTDDWILFAKNNDAPSATNYLADCWQYTYRDTDKTGVASTTSGSISIKAPAVPGTYKAWYCFNNGFNCKASVSVTVTKPQFTCRAPGNTASSIKNVIIIVSENHSFDSYFGRYCKAAFGSKPSCNIGPECCEAYNPIPGVEPVVLDDGENMGFNPDHSTDGEICRMNGGLMDKYVTGCFYSDVRNFAMANGSVGSASHYWGWASNYAMSDRFFQSAPGASAQNDMYFARGAYVFLDNTMYPGAGGAAGPCPSPFSAAACAAYNDPTIGDLLQDCNVPFAWYQVAYPNIDVSDDPFLYYPSLANSPNKDSMFKEFNQLGMDIANGNLPPITYVKGGYGPSSFGAFQDTSEHPGNSISGGEKLNAAVIDQILASDKYKDNTVIFLVPDESGGFRDSVTPPARSTVDNKLYGPRTPFLAVGNMVKKNYISHISAEPASIIRFIESNWLADAVPGQLQTRDAAAGSLNDMFDQAKTGFIFP